MLPFLKLEIFVLSLLLEIFSLAIDVLGWWVLLSAFQRCFLLPDQRTPLSQGQFRWPVAWAAVESHTHRAPMLGRMFCCACLEHFNSVLSFFLILQWLCTFYFFGYVFVIHANVTSQNILPAYCLQIVSCLKHCVANQ